MKERRRVAVSVLFVAGVACCAAAQTPSESATWELAMMGVTAGQIPVLAKIARKRPVDLAIVGQGGVSESVIAELLSDGNTLTYHGCADPKSNTHDTQEARVILDITRPLGVQVHFHIFQPGESFTDVADKFRQAAKVADVVVTFQSFWGTNAAHITEAIRESPEALVLSPYVEHGGRDTNETPQGHAAKPWDEGSIRHFATVVPLSRRSGDGRLLHPSARGEADTEVINFIAPSYHANGPGGTCPSAAVVTAVVCYVFGASAEKPGPPDVIDLLRRTSRIDRKALTSLPPLTDAAADKLESEIKSLASPPEGARRTLDATGVIHLGEVFREIAD